MTNRFIKLDAQANALPADATDYEGILDTTTGLIWSKTLPCGEVTQPEAEAAASSFTLFGAQARLPSRSELLTLVDDTHYSPAIDPIFECESDWYWTSTPAAFSPSDYAWLVYFYDGYSSCNGHDSGGFVRAVRVSQ